MTDNCRNVGLRSQTSTSTLERIIRFANFDSDEILLKKFLFICNFADIMTDVFLNTTEKIDHI